MTEFNQLFAKRVRKMPQHRDVIGATVPASEPACTLNRVHDGLKKFAAFGLARVRETFETQRANLREFLMQTLSIAAAPRIHNCRSIQTGRG
jgi:hypothetical protein